jgi:hypothetical protein
MLLWSFSLVVAAPHQHLFQPSVADESEIHKLVLNLTVSLPGLLISIIDSCPSSLDWPLPCFADYWHLLMALGIIPSAPEPAAKAFADLKVDLDKEKVAWLAAQIEVDVLTQVVRDLKISADRFASQIPTLEGKVKHPENKVVDGLNEVRAWELYLERTTRANDDYQKQIAQLAKKLESKSFGSL